MKTISKIVCIAGMAGLAATASAQVFTLTHNFAVDPADQTIPDGDLNGVTFKGVVADAPTSLSTNAFAVKLDIAGDPFAANGDLYVFLRFEDGKQAILLNRPGYPANGGLGYQDNGMNVRLFDGVDPSHLVDGVPSQYTDVHNYQDAGIPTDVATGTYSSDGRSIDPLALPNAFSAASRDATLSVFQGINPNGEWQLFIADVSSGGSAKLNSWGLDFTPIPEPQEYAMAVGLGLMAFALYRRRILKGA